MVEVSGQSKAENQIRIQVYEDFPRGRADRGHALEDWLTAGNELICPVSAMLVDEESRIIAEVRTDEIPSHDLSVLISHQSMLIHVLFKETGAGGEAAELRPSLSRRAAFAVVHASRPVDPFGIRVECNPGILRITVPTGYLGEALKKSA